MNKFVAALTWLLGGLLATTTFAVAMAAADPRAVSQEPIPLPVWTVEDVAISGYANALAVDEFGRPHLLYIDPVSGALRYAVREYDGWHYEDIANESLDTPYLDFDLQIGPDYTPCLVYATEKPVASEPMDTKLVYGCRDEDGWTLTAIEDGGRTPNLILTSDGQPFIALVQGNDAVYMTREGETWRREIAGSDPLYLNQVFLTRTSTHSPVILYRGASGQFRADRHGDGSWTSTPLANATIYAAYFDFDPFDWLWLAVNDGEAAWGHPPFFLARLKLVRPIDSDPPQSETIEEAYDWQIAVDLAPDLHTGFPVMAYIGPDGTLHDLYWDENGRHEDSPRARGNSEVSRSLMSNDDKQFIAFAEDNQLKLAERQVVWFDHWLYSPVVVGP